MTKEHQYIKKTPTDTFVSFNLYDKNGMIISEHPGRICFSDVSYELIPAEADHLTFWKDKSVIPYNFETCKRWTEHINWCGFPCSIAEVKNRIVWTFKLSDFKYKLHFVCALTLARTLAEKGICHLVELYFDSLAENPKLDKFEALQLAHRNIDKVCDYYEYNTNHMVTFPGNGSATVSKREFLDNLAREGSLMAVERAGRLTDLWRGLNKA